MRPQDRLLIALDTTDVRAASDLAGQLKGLVGGIKLGKEFFTANGPQGVRAVQEQQLPLFLDLKFHDIPNTVAGAVRASLPLQPFLLDVHASGGRAMMEAAAAAALEAKDNRPLMLAITILTSLTDDDLRDIGMTGSAQSQVVRLATLASSCKMDGVVCSPKEIRPIREKLGPDFKLVVPGIRPLWAASGDQKRITTPEQAIKDGADYLVIGRPVTKADNPIDAVRRIIQDISNGG